MVSLYFVNMAMDAMYPPENVNYLTRLVNVINFYQEKGIIYGKLSTHAI